MSGRLIPPAGPRIEVEQLCVDYNGTVALYDADLSLPPGCICGLVGMNGAGKTTLFKALTGCVRPSHGRIRINGQTVLAAQRDQVVAYVPQSEGIDCNFPISVWDVVMMGRYGSMSVLRWPRQSDRVAVRDALERVDLLPLAQRPIGALSGGQRKRVALARASAPRPQILLADEPTGNLDGTNGAAVMRLLFDLRDKHGATLILVTHSDELAARCDRIIRLADGRIAPLSKAAE